MSIPQARRLAGLALLPSLLLISTAYAQDRLPLMGPGLGNLTYQDSELFDEISTIKWNTPTNQNGIPQANFTLEGQTTPRKPYGINVAIMHNGYMVTAFAPDSGEATGGFLVYDVSNPRDIRLIKTIFEPRGITSQFREPHAFGVSTIGGTDVLAIPSTRGVEFWDFTDINDLKPISRLALPGVTGGDYTNVNWQMWWQAPYLYVSGGNLGLFIVDAADPANPRLATRPNNGPNPIPTTQTGGFNLGPVFAMGNTMLLSGMETSNGFTTLDISDPVDPKIIDQVSRLPFYYATCFNGQKLYSSGRQSTGTVVGYDISNPSRIVKEEGEASPPEGLYCATQDNHMFIGGQRNIIKYDVSNPAEYRELARSVTEPNQGVLAPRGNSDPDMGQVALFGNLVFIGSDHGTNTAFRPHQAAPDTTPPKIIAASPSNDARGQSTTSRIGLAFSDSILPETVNAENFGVRKRGGQFLPGFYSVQLGMVNFSPAEALETNAVYEVVLKKGGIKDYAGNGIAEDYVGVFSTSAPIVAQTRETNRWPLRNDLTDLLGTSSGTLTNAEFEENALSLTRALPGVTLPNTEVATVLAGTATVAYRIRTRQTGSNNPWEAPGLFGRDQEGGTSDVFWGWIDRDGRLRLSVGNVSTTNPGTISAQPINDGNWHDVSLTRNATTGEQVMSVDGNITRSNSSPGILGLGSPFNLLGRIQGNPVALEADISDVRVFNWAIPASDFAWQLNTPNVLPQQQTGQSSTFDPARLNLSGTSFAWNFGEDGAVPVTTSGANAVATHDYTKPGNYVVRVAVTGEDGSVRNHSFVQSVVNPVTERPPANTTNITGDGRFVYALDPDAGLVTAIDAVSNEKQWSLAVGKDPRTLALDRQGQLWVTVQGDDKYVRINPTTRVIESFTLPYGSAPHGIVIAPDGNTGLMTLAGKSRFVTFNPFTGAIGGEVRLPKGDLRAIAVTADSKTAYVARFRAKEENAELYQIDLSKVSRVSP